ncbi:MAG TPA: V-type ATPase subunit, partial [Candidatus Caccocola faecipullorum]|nr:V-type ATPase subunit [Candidatus Caccocola faecipullorum]
NSFVPQKELVALLRLPYDFSNAKVMLKSVFSVRSGGKKRWDLLTSLASYPVDKLISDVETEDYQLLPFGLSTLFPKCLSVWEQSRDVLEAERLLDKQMFAVMLEEAEKLAIPEILAWVKLRIDGENIRSLVRLKRFGFDSARAASFLHEGGNIDLNTLAPMIAEPFETWGRMIDYSDLAGLFASVDAGASFADVTMNLEKALDDYYLSSISGSRYSPNAPGNVITYLWAKELEVKNIRMIVVSKSTGKDSDQVRRLLRNVCA